MTGSLKAMRLVQHMLGNGMTGAALQDELSNAGALGAFRAALAQRSVVRAIVNSPEACDIVLGSALATSALGGAGDTLEEVANSLTGLGKFAATPQIMQGLLDSPLVGKTFARLRYLNGLPDTARLSHIVTLNEIASTDRLMASVAGSDLALDAFLGSSRFVGRGMETLRVADGGTTNATYAAHQTIVDARGMGANAAPYMLNLPTYGAAFANSKVFVGQCLNGTATTRDGFFSTAVTANVGRAVVALAAANGEVLSGSAGFGPNFATLVALLSNGTYTKYALQGASIRSAALASANFASATVEAGPLAANIARYIAGDQADSATRLAVWGSDTLLGVWNTNTTVATALRSGNAVRTFSLINGAADVTSLPEAKAIWISASRLGNTSVVTLTSGKRAGSAVGSGTLTSGASTSNGTATTNIFATEGTVRVSHNADATLYYHVVPVEA